MGKKLTIEYVRNEIEKIGYELLSDEYINANKKLKIRCDKGHEYEISWLSFNRGARCVYCSGKRLTLESVKDYVVENARGYTCLSNCYKNSITKLLFRCDKGHEYEADFGHFKSGRRCPICGFLKTAEAHRYTIEYVQNEIEKAGYKLLSDKYKDCREKLKIQCDKGHVYETTFSIFKIGCRCPTCSKVGKKTIEIVKREMEKYGYSCLSTEYINNNSVLYVKCNKGHIYKTNWAYFNAGNRCPECYGSKKPTIDYVRTEIEKAGYKCLSSEYINNTLKLEIQCDKGHKYEASWGKFKNGRRCPVCSGKTKPTIASIRAEIFALEPGYKCLSNRYIDSKTKLRFRCDKGHIYETLWNVFKQGCRCPECSITRQPTIKEIQNEMKIIAPTYKCLSKDYINASTKLDFQCSKGHKFSSIWGSFYRQGTRCPICSQRRVTEASRFTIAFVKDAISECGYVCISNEYNNNLTPLLVKCDKGHIFKTCWSNFHTGSRCPICAVEERIKYHGDEIREIKIYRHCAARIATNNYKKYKDSINPENLPRSYTEYHLDHIYTVIDGFNNGILPSIISNPTNLQMLSAFDNQSKNDRSDITKEELFRRYRNFKKGGIKCLTQQK